MKIVHVLRSMQIGGSFNGIESHVLTLAAAQKNRGHSVVAVTDKRSYFTDACEQRGIQSFLIPGKWATPPDKETVDGLAELFTSLGADLIHCQMNSVSVAAITAGNKIDIPCVFTLHEWIPGGASHLYENLRFSAIAVNGDIGEHAKKAMPREADIRVIPLGTKASQAATARKPSGAAPGLLLVGSLTPEKGIDNAILAMSVLHGRLGQACHALNIYGDAGSRGGEVAKAEGFPLWNEYLEEMVSAVGLSHLVSFRGNQPGILDRCDGNDILLVSSRGETGPMVVLEAMSRGMPIVSTRVGTVAEMLPDERYGRIVPVNSIMAFADAIEATLADIADERFDPELLIARHRSHYSDVVMAERTDSVYQAAMRT